jgi:hypothetical protein
MTEQVYTKTHFRTSNHQLVGNNKPPHQFKLGLLYKAITVLT